MSRSKVDGANDYTRAGILEASLTQSQQSSRQQPSRLARLPARADEQDSAK
jgi:hypothetical protein